MRNCVWGSVLLVISGWLGGHSVVYGQEGQLQSGTPIGYKDIPMMSSGELRFFIDTAGFRGPKGYTREEFYILIDAKQIQFVPEQDRHVAQMDLSIMLVDTSGTPVEKETWTRNVSVRDIKGLQTAALPFRDLVRFDLLPGVYRMTCAIEDIYGDKQGTCEGLLKVHNFEGEALVASDILFVSKLEKAEKKGRFAKYGWNVVPNTTRSYFAGKPMQFYFEIYNLAAHSDRPNSSFVLGYSLTDTSGILRRTFPSKRLIKPGKSIVKTDSLDTEGLEGGTYYFQVEAFDRSSREHIRQRRMVFLTAQETPKDLTEDQKDQLRYYAYIQYIAGKKERDAFKKLDTQEVKMQFLRAFWKNLDTSPETLVNERLLEHMRRMRYAENNFSAGHKKRGSDTDKGRVYITYGAPDDIQYNTGGAGEKPFEAWYYERQRHSEFFFRDRRGVGVYELVHSTHPGEMYNPGWRDEL